MPPSSPKQPPPASARIIDLTQPERGTDSTSESSQKTSSRKRRRRDRRASKKDGDSASANMPGSHQNEPSTSKTQLEDGEMRSDKDAPSKDSRKHSSSRHQKRDRSDRSSRKKSKSPEPAINLNATFTGDDEFIPFGPLPFAVEDEEEDLASKFTKGKQKEREVDDRRRDEKEDNKKGRNRDHEREWDRGKSTYRDRDDPRDRRNSNGKRRRHDYDSDDGYENKKQRMDAASRKCPWVYGLELEKCKNVAEMMHKEVESFVDWISPTPEEDEIRGLIVRQISQAIAAKFPDATTHPFGSYQTKLYLPLGDIDLVVISDTMAYSDKSSVLHHLANTLKRSGITTHVTIIAKAKVPIVKFVTTHGKFKVDISINQANGLVSGNIILGFLRDIVPTATTGESKALRSLVMITKAFLAQRSMNEVYTGGLGSYSIVCLAVSFLQMHPKIRRGEMDPEKNLGVLVMEFFELYGERFNYDDVGISLRQGGMYFNKRQRGWAQDYGRRGLFVSIEDPADPTNDISSGSYNFHKVRTAFAGAYGILTSTAYMRASILNSRNQGTSFRLRSSYEPEDLSVLCTVMGVTQETINHRRMVQEIYDRRIIHNILGVKPAPIIVHPKMDDDSSESNPKSGSNSKTGTTKSGELSIMGAANRRAAVEVVEDGWDNDMEFSSEDESRDSRYNYGGVNGTRRDVGRRGGAGRRESYGHEEEGRYAIGDQPPKKRQRTGKRSDEHTVFIEDSDEDTSMTEMEEGEYMSDDDSDTGSEDEIYLLSSGEDDWEDTSRSRNGKANGGKGSENTGSSARSPLNRLIFKKKGQESKKDGSGDSNKSKQDGGKDNGVARQENKKGVDDIKTDSKEKLKDGKDRRSYWLSKSTVGDGADDFDH
ncbi:hypothetical protein CVT24_009356 [Panaeolus cyanescens]|uniref:polynucleotide adenylyltransferase n=1 Tax=Panaeolus cyanescens TaxID=181874 RepID=A0A409Y7U4_9AGAR|nr:hypothetical protein CVT24_009356 [Panaeolus cyanescens]